MSEMYDSYPQAFHAIGSFVSALRYPVLRSWWVKRCMAGVTFKACPVQHPQSKLDIEYFEPGSRQNDPVVVFAEFDAEFIRLANQLHAHHAAGGHVTWASYSAGYDRIERLRDWLNSLDERMRGKLWKLSWTQAVEHADKWHAAMEKVRIDAAAGLAGVDRFVECDNGWKWCRLGTVDAMDREGLVMGHCVGKGSYDGYAHAKLAGAVMGIWSLRDDKGHSHVTVEIGSAGSRDGGVVHRLLQAKGPGNRRLTPSEQAHVDTLTTALDVKTKVDLTGESFGIGRLWAAYVEDIRAALIDRPEDYRSRALEQFWVTDEMDEFDVEIPTFRTVGIDTQNAGTVELNLRPLTPEAFIDTMVQTMSRTLGLTPEQVRGRAAVVVRDGPVARRFRNAQFGEPYREPGAEPLRPVARSRTDHRAPPAYRQHEARTRGRMHGRI